MSIDTATLRAKFDATGVKAGKEELEKLAPAAEKAEGKLAAFTGQAKLLGGAITALGLGALASEAIQYSDAWQRSANQLRLVTNGTKELEGAQKALLAVANDTRSSYDATAELYTKLARSTQEMGLSTEELIGLTTTINQSFAASGASAQESAGAIRQLGQALASGALRGDEFNTISENAPGIMRAIADSLQMTIGELRAYAAEGKITAETVVTALQGASESIEDEFSKSVRTFGDAMQIAQNNMTAFVGGSGAVGTSVQLLGDGIIILSENADSAAIAFAGLSTVMLTRMLPAMAAVTGPIGLIVAGITAGAIAIDQFQKSAERAFNALTRQEIQANIAELGSRLIELQERLDSPGGGRNRTGWANQAENLREEIGKLTDRYAQLTRQMDENTPAAEKSGRALGGVSDELEAANEHFESLNNQLDAHVKAHEQWGRLVNEGADATEHLNARLEYQQELLQSLNGGTSEAAKGYITFTSEVKKAGEETERFGEAQFTMLDSIQRDWADTFYEMTQEIDSFADAVNNVFDGVTEAFLKMLANMASQDLAAALFGYGTGGNLASLVTGGASGGGIIGNILGGIGGAGGGQQAITAAQAAAMNLPASAATLGTGGGLMSSLGAAATNPWLWGAAALAYGASNDFWADPDGYQRSNAGILGTPTPGLKSQYNAGQVNFASGFSATGFQRRTPDGVYNSVIDQYQSVDSQITSLARQLGVNVDLSGQGFRGVGEDGTGPGTFLGIDQLDSYAQQMVEMIAAMNGLSEVVSELGLTTASASEIIDMLTGAVEANSTSTDGNTSSTDENTGSTDENTGALDSAMQAQLKSAVSGLDALMPSSGGGGSSGGRGGGGGSRPTKDSYEAQYKASMADLTASRRASGFYNQFEGTGRNGVEFVSSSLTANLYGGPYPEFDTSPRDLSELWIRSDDQYRSSAINLYNQGEYGSMTQPYSAALAASSSLRWYQQQGNDGIYREWTQELAQDLHTFLRATNQEDFVPPIIQVPPTQEDLDMLAGILEMVGALNTIADNTGDTSLAARRSDIRSAIA